MTTCAFHRGDDDHKPADSPRVTAFKFGYCKCKIVCVVEGLAPLVCTQCGRQGNSCFEHDCRPPSNIQYIEPGYVHVRYRAQEEGYPSIDVSTLQDTLAKSLEYQMDTYEICPNVMYDALKQLKGGKNPTYQPLKFSYEDLERLVATFKSWSEERFAAILRRTKCKKEVLPLSLVH